MNIYKVTKNVVDYYKSHVKGHENTHAEMIRRRLTRNILLAKELPVISRNVKPYLYGNLVIITRRNTVIWLYNIEGEIPFNVDRKKRKELNTLLGIC